jgi:hypothetical protein
MPVAIQVCHRNLHAASRTRAVVDQVLDPADISAGLAQKLIPVEPERLASSWIVLMRHVAFAGHKVGLSIAV